MDTIIQEKTTENSATAIKCGEILLGATVSEEKLHSIGSWLTPLYTGTKSLCVPNSGAWLLELEFLNLPALEGELVIAVELVSDDPLSKPFGLYYNMTKIETGKNNYSLYLPLNKGNNYGIFSVAQVDKAIKPTKLDKFKNLKIISCILRTPDILAKTLPRDFLIPITSYCNYRCVICDHGLPDKPVQQAHYPREILDRLLAAFEASDSFVRVALTGLGEPLLSPILRETVESIQNPLVWFHFCTNGSLLTPEWSQWIVSQKISHVNISIDAGTEETYAKIRRAKFKRVVNNVEALAKEINHSDLANVLLVLNMTLMRENLRDISPFLELASRVGASAYVNQLHPQPPDNRYNWIIKYPDFHFDYHQQVLPLDNLTLNALTDASNLARKKSVPFYVESIMRPTLLGEEEKEYKDVSPIATCPYPWSGDDQGTAVVHTDGSVSFCCLSSPIGKLEPGKSLLDVWNSETACDARRQMSQGYVPNTCASATCRYVQLQKKWERRKNVDEQKKHSVSTTEVSKSIKSVMHKKQNLLIKANELKRKNKLNEAIVEYGRAIEENPSFSWLHFFLGEALAESEDWVNAVYSLRQAVRLNPDYDGFSKKLELVLARLEKEKVNRPELFKEEAKKYAHQGLELEQQGKLQTAIEYYQKALELDTEQPIYVYYNLGKLLLDRNEYDLAEKTFDILILKFPNYPHGLEGLALVAQRKEDFRLAFERWNNFIAAADFYLSSYGEISEEAKQQELSRLQQAYIDRIYCNLNMGDS